MKLFRALIAICWLFFLSPEVFAQFNYATNGSTVTVTGYTGTLPGTVTISNFVTSIGNSAFVNKTSLTNLTIPASVTSIGTEAFYYCTHMTNLTISNGVTSIGDTAFQGCNGLTSLTLPGSVTSAASAFEFCTGLTNVTMLNGATSIGYEEFEGCTNLTSVALPNTLTSIAGFAFYNCAKLTNITIPSSVTFVADAAFASCTNLTAITANAQNTNYSSVNGVLFNQNRTALVAFPGGLSGSYVIPNGVASIVEEAFLGCVRLSSVTMPNSLTNIGDYAFQNCTNLTGFFFTGNAPSADSTVFVNVNASAMVYYLPNTAAWSSPFAGIPAVLWNPSIPTSNASIGISNNRFGFTITGPANIPIVVQATTDLTRGVWTPLQSCTLTNGSIYFSDPAWANYPSRFYSIAFP